MNAIVAELRVLTALTREISSDIDGTYRLSHEVLVYQDRKKISLDLSMFSLGTEI